MISKSNCLSWIPTRVSWPINTIYHDPWERHCTCLCHTAHFTTWAATELQTLAQYTVHISAMSPSMFFWIEGINACAGVTAALSWTGRLLNDRWLGHFAKLATVLSIAVLDLYRLLHLMWCIPSMRVHEILPLAHSYTVPERKKGSCIGLCMYWKHCQFNKCIS